MLFGLIGVVIFILDIIALVDVFMSNEEGTKKALWVVLILVLPLLGMILYFLFGKKPASGVV